MLLGTTFLVGGATVAHADSDVNSTDKSVEVTTNNQLAVTQPTEAQNDSSTEKQAVATSQAGTTAAPSSRSQEPAVSQTVNKNNSTAEQSNTLQTKATSSASASESSQQVQVAHNVDNGTTGNASLDLADGQTIQAAAQSLEVNGAELKEAKTATQDEITTQVKFHDTGRENTPDTPVSTTTLTEDQLPTAIYKHDKNATVGDLVNYLNEKIKEANEHYTVSPLMQTTDNNLSTADPNWDTNIDPDYETEVRDENGVVEQDSNGKIKTTNLKKLYEEWLKNKNPLSGIAIDTTGLDQTQKLTAQPVTLNIKHDIGYTTGALYKNIYRKINYIRYEMTGDLKPEYDSVKQYGKATLAKMANSMSPNKIVTTSDGKSHNVIAYYQWRNRSYDMLTGLPSVSFNDISGTINTPVVFDEKPTLQGTDGWVTFDDDVPATTTGWLNGDYRLRAGKFQYNDNGKTWAYSLEISTNGIQNFVDNVGEEWTLDDDLSDDIHYVYVNSKGLTKQIARNGELSLNELKSINGHVVEKVSKDTYRVQMSKNDIRYYTSKTPEITKVYYHAQPIDFTFEDVSESNFKQDLSNNNYTATQELSWDNDTDDYQTYTNGKVTNPAKYEVRDATNSNGQSLDQIIENLKKQGYTLVSIAQNADNTGVVTANEMALGTNLKDAKNIELDYNKDKVVKANKIQDIHFTIQLKRSGATKESEKKTINRIVHFKTDISHQTLKTDNATESATFGREWYVDGSGNIVNVAKDSKGNPVSFIANDGRTYYVIDQDNIDTNKGNWTLEKGTDTFKEVNVPEITNGLLPGDWIRVSAERNSSNGPETENDVVLSDSDLARYENGANQEYTIYYAQKAIEHQDKKTVQRIVHFKTVDGQTLRNDNPVENVTYRQHYFTALDKDGKTIFVNAKQLADGTLVVDDSNNNQPATDTWIENGNGEFGQVDVPEITDGLLPGDWVRVSAEQNSGNNGPEVKDEVVPADSITAENIQNGADQEYTIYYAQKATEHQDKNTVKRTVNFVTEDEYGNKTLLDPTSESVTYSRHYFTALDQDGKTIFVNANKLKDGTWVVDYQDTTTPVTDAWKEDGNGEFVQIDKPEITDGKLPGDWIRTRATRDNDNGPTITDDKIVPADSITAENIKNGANQEYTIYYAQKSTPKEETVTRVRHIRYFDGLTGDSLENLAPSVTQKVSFKRTGIYQNGKLIGYNTTGNKDKYGQLTVDTTDPDKAWIATTNDGRYDAVKSPDLTKNGYKLVPSFKLHEDNQDAATAPEEEASALKDSQDIDIYYFHNTEKVQESADALHTIDYKYANGPYAGQTAAPDFTQTITYTRKGTKDLVTGKITWDGDWQASDTFKDVTSPEITDYMADVEKVTAPTVNTSELTDGKHLEFHDHILYTQETPTPKTYNVVTNYVDENGNVLQDPTTEANFKDGKTYEYKEVKSGSDQPAGTINGKDVEVTYVYKLKDETPTSESHKVVVNYVDEAGNVLQDPVTESDLTNGTDYTTTNKKPTTIEKDGKTYEFVRVDQKSDPENGTINGKDVEVTYVYKLKENTPTPSTETHKVVTNYVDENGNVLQDPSTQADLSNGSAYTTNYPSEITKDGKIYEFVRVDQKSDPENGTINGKDISVTYVYKLKEDTPVTPDQPTTPDKQVTPDQNTNSNQSVTPEKPVEPATPVQPTQPGTPVETVTPSKQVVTPKQEVATPAQPAKSGKLPQTGNTDNQAASLGALGLLGTLLTGLGLGKKRRRN